MLDLTTEAADRVAIEHGQGRASVQAVDATNTTALARILGGSGAAVLVNAASYRVNLSAMEGALAAGCNYVDLGGLYHTTLQQLALHDRFAAAGRCAVVGMGASPGKTNLLAALAAAQLDRVDALHVAAAATDPTPPGHTGLTAPYALETILDEVTLPAVVLRDGVPDEVAALTPGGDIVFPDPIGTRPSVYTLHSELATFPSSFPDLRDASFRLSLAPALAERIELLARCGLADLEPLTLPDGTSVVPRQVLLAALARSRGTVPPSPRTTAVHLVDAIGRRGRDAVAVRAVALTVPHDRWGLGGGVVSTAAPAAEAARRLLRGDVARSGVLPPEEAFVAERFLEALAHTGCTVTLSEVTDAG